MAVQPIHPQLGFILTLFYTERFVRAIGLFSVPAPPFRLDCERRGFFVLARPNENLLTITFNLSLCSSI
jgi:hypothetical protein